MQCRWPATLFAMVGRVNSRRNRVAGALALLGAAFYALLLPWHLTSQFDRQLFVAEFGNEIALICSSDGASDASRSGTGAPVSSCPICKGLAAFQLALAPAAQIIAPPSTVDRLLRFALHDDAAGAVTIPPRSRGPPSQA